MLFPATAGTGATARLLSSSHQPDRLPRWSCGSVSSSRGGDGRRPRPRRGGPRGRPRSWRHAHDRFERPSLRGRRLADPTGDGEGRRRARLDDCGSVPRSSTCPRRRLTIEARDEPAGLALRTESEPRPGGALRVRHTLTNTGRPYLFRAWMSCCRCRTRSPRCSTSPAAGPRAQPAAARRSPTGCGCARAARGRPGLDARHHGRRRHARFRLRRTARCGACTSRGAATSVLRVERDAADGAVARRRRAAAARRDRAAAGRDATRRPGCYVAAAGDGLDGLAAPLARAASGRCRPPEPPRPVVLNVWEAVYFDHDLDRLRELADRRGAGRRGAVRAGRRLVPRPPRRHRRPRRLVRRRGGLARGPEPARSTTSAASAWSSGCGSSRRWSTRTPTCPASTRTGSWPAGDRPPLEHRHQHVLDLARPEVVRLPLRADRRGADEYAIDYVKWDHNRDLLEAGARPRGGAPAVHAQTLAFYRLLDALRARAPDVEWE